MKIKLTYFGCLLFIFAFFAYAEGPIQQEEEDPVLWQAEIEYDPGDSGNSTLPEEMDTTTRTEYVKSAWFGSSWGCNPLIVEPKDIVVNWGEECAYYKALEADDNVYWQTYAYPPVTWQMYYFEDVGEFIEVTYGGEYAEWWNLDLYVWIDSEGIWELIHSTGGSTSSFWVDVTDYVMDGNLIVLCFDPEQTLGQTITCDFSVLEVAYEE